MTERPAEPAAVPDGAAALAGVLTPAERSAVPKELETPWYFGATEAGTVFTYTKQPGNVDAWRLGLAPGSHHPDVWHDVNRMLTLNGEQTRRGLENHICPLQFDIVDRLINRFSNAGELVFDPFGGLFTVPLRAIRAGRRGRATELSTDYFFDGVKHLQAAELELSMPSLFDTLPAQDQEQAA